MFTGIKTAALTVFKATGSVMVGALEVVAIGACFTLGAEMARSAIAAGKRSGERAAAKKKTVEVEIEGRTVNVEI